MTQSVATLGFDAPCDRCARVTQLAWYRLELLCGPCWAGRLAADREDEQRHGVVGRAS